MKLVCDRSALLDALALAGGVVVSRTPSPALLCFKFVAADGILTISATDTEVGLSVPVASVSVTDEGEALIPADKLNQIVRASEDSTLSIQVSNKIAVIKGHDSTFKVFGSDPKDFPGVQPFPASRIDFETTAGTLARLIHRTLFATAVDNSRYAINGVLMERKGKRLRMVATDGRRLAMAKGECSRAVEKDCQCIVPTKALNVLGKLLSDPDEAVAVAIDESMIIFRVGDGADAAVLSSRLVEGSFPPFEDVIPKEQDKRVTFDAGELTSAVRRAALLTNEESKGVRLAFDGKQLLLSSRAPELGEAEITVALEKYEGEAIEIGFNPQFITDVLKVIDSEQVIIELKAPNKPGVIKVGNDFTYVVMPVSLG
ncbi:MAG: DNA polymerase III subunit beta [Phycisphaerae bacterium]|mgnify:CR=1 FL=1|nr:DNA polymerase III subunit beta [Phycisphaerae bacterium]